MFAVLDYKKQGKYVILVGDLNIAHSPKDVNPKTLAEDPIYHGYSKDELEWLNSVTSEEAESLCLIDTFRKCFPNVNNKFTVWDQRTEARSRNEGVRSVYICPNSIMLPHAVL